MPCGWGNFFLSAARHKLVEYRDKHNPLLSRFVKCDGFRLPSVWACSGPISIHFPVTKFGKSRKFSRPIHGKLISHRFDCILLAVSHLAWALAASGFQRPPTSKARTRREHGRPWQTRGTSSLWPSGLAARWPHVAQTVCPAARRGACAAVRGQTRVVSTASCKAPSPAPTKASQFYPVWQGQG